MFDSKLLVYALWHPSVHLLYLGCWEPPPVNLTHLTCKSHSLDPFWAASATSQSQEIIEGIGYPGQKNSHGGLCTLGRIYYGPGRYDYGRPKMPKGWVANFLYPLWEFGFLKAFQNDGSTSTLDRSG